VLKGAFKIEILLPNFKSSKDLPYYCWYTYHTTCLTFESFIHYYCFQC